MERATGRKPILPFERALVILGRLFTERQRIVAECLICLRPDLLASASRPRNDRTPNQGLCGSRLEWRYRLNGSTCRLQHRTVGEILTWDAPHLDRFAVPFLAQWLHWQFEKQVSTAAINGLTAVWGQQPALETIEQNLLPSLYRLEKRGWVRRHEHDQFEVLPFTVP